VSPEYDPKSVEHSVKATQEQILEGVQASQKWILESVRAFTEAAQQAAQPASAQLPAPLPAEDLNKMVDDAFDFTEKLLASQREFTHNLVAASAVNVGGGEKDKPAKGGGEKDKPAKD